MAEWASRELVDGIVSLATEAGLAVADLELAPEESRLTRVGYHQLWEEIARRAPDRPIGLELGASLDEGRFGLLDFAARSAPSVREALFALTRHLGVLYSGPDLGLEITDGTATVSYVDGRSPRHAAEWAVAGLCSFVAQVGGPECRPTWVRFQHPEPQELGPYERVFGCRVDFAQPKTAIDLPAEVLDIGNARANERLYHLLSKYVTAESEQATAAEAADFPSRARRVIEEELAAGRPSRDAVAERLSMSGSTLQRHLKKLGHGSFNAFLDQIRHELAIRFLSESEASVGQLALQLGYTDTSNFVRAFRKWTGVTPGQYRDRQTHG